MIYMLYYSNIYLCRRRVMCIIHILRHYFLINIRFVNIINTYNKNISTEIDHLHYSFINN